MYRYPELIIAPMRRELTDLGARELRRAADVDAFLEQARDGTAMIVVNSVCGCAAGSMRPGLAGALRRAPQPDHIGTVFAGADLEATERARQHFAPYPPSSPAVALFRGGKLVFMLERRQIQGQPPEAVAATLGEALRSHVTPVG